MSETSSSRCTASALLAIPLPAAAIMIAAMPFLGAAWRPADTIAAALPAVPILACGALLCGRRHAAAVVPTLLAITLSAASLGREVWGGPARIRDGAPRVVLVTHNVASANVAPEQTAAMLAASGADILLLQEVDGRFAPILDTLRTRFPYGSRCRPRCSLAILSRWPTARVRYRWRDANDAPYGPGLVWTRIAVPGAPMLVPVASVHLSRKLSGAGRKAEREELAEGAVRFAPLDAMLLGGDFNLVPWSAGMRRFETSLGPVRRITRARFSFPARLGTHEMPVPLVPIDHLFAGSRWGVASVARMPRTGSDHYPIRAVLVWQRGGT